MTRLYTEADVRAMLVRAFVGGHAAHADEPLPTYRLDDAAGYLASSILSTAPVAAPDLSRLAEAVKWEALYIIGAQSVGTSVTAADAVRAIDQAIRSLDLAPIIAASGTGQGPGRSEVEAYVDGVQAGRATMARDAAEAVAGEAERIRRTGRNHAARLACLRAADAIRALVAPLPKPQEPPR